MPVWGVVILAAIFLAGGIMSLYTGTKTGKRVWTFAGIFLFLLCVVSILYLAAAFLLLGGIQ